MLGNDAYAVQSSFVKQLKSAAAELNVTVILIAHPRKTEQGKDLVNDDVSGSADITNLADIVLTYSRITAQNGKDAGYDSKIQVTKNRLTGRLAVGETAIRVHYSEKTKRIISDDDKDPNRLMCCFKNNYIPF